MRELLHATALVALLATLFPGPADARVICGERNSIVEKLRQIHNERRRVEAVTGAGTLMEIFVSRPAPGRSWSRRRAVPLAWFRPAKGGSPWFNPMAKLKGSLFS